MKELIQAHPLSSNHHSDSLSSSHTPSDNSTHPTFQRTKKISKEQSKINVSHLIHLEKKERKKLSREEKNQIQRLKNKDSAQRSRDQKRVYIQELEQENVRLVESHKRLIQQMDIVKKCCWRCKLQLEQNFQNQELKMIEEDSIIQDQVQFLDDPIFERVPSLVRNGSGFMKYLFVVAITLAMMSGDVSNNQTQIPRLLQVRIPEQALQTNDTTELFTKKMDYPIIPAIKTNQLNMYHSHFENQTQFTNYFSQGTKMCLKNLVKKNQMSLMGTQKNLRLTQQFQNKDLLFCHLPKIFDGENSKQNKFVSRVFDIILQGQQVKKIALTNGNISLQPFPYQGLYVVTAELKQIRKYNETKNCLIDQI